MNPNSEDSKLRSNSSQQVTGTVHFMDGTRVVLQWPRQAGDDPYDVVANVRKALEAEKILAEVNGNLLLIPVRNIKYIHIAPAPVNLPQGVLLGATLLE